MLGLYTLNFHLRKPSTKFHQPPSTVHHYLNDSEVSFCTGSLPSMALVALGHLTHLGTDASQNSVWPAAEFLLPWEGRSAESPYRFSYLQPRCQTCSHQLFDPSPRTLPGHWHFKGCSVAVAMRIIVSAQDWDQRT